MGDSKYLVRIEAAMKIDIDLYRGGNSTSPRLDNVRDKDVVKYKDVSTGLTKVMGMSGGDLDFHRAQARGQLVVDQGGYSRPSQAGHYA